MKGVSSRREGMRLKRGVLANFTPNALEFKIVPLVGVVRLARQRTAEGAIDKGLNPERLQRLPIHRVRRVAQIHIRQLRGRTGTWAWSGVRRVWLHAAREVRGRERRRKEEREERTGETGAHTKVRTLATWQQGALFQAPRGGE